MKLLKLAFLIRDEVTETILVILQVNYSWHITAFKLELSQQNWIFKVTWPPPIDRLGYKARVFADQINSNITFWVFPWSLIDLYEAVHLRYPDNISSFLMFVQFISMDFMKFFYTHTKCTTFAYSSVENSTSKDNETPRLQILVHENSHLIVVS